MLLAFRYDSENMVYLARGGVRVIKSVSRVIGYKQKYTCTSQGVVFFFFSVKFRVQW